MDGSYNTTRGGIAHRVAELQHAPDGLTAARFESLVRAIGEEMKTARTLETVSAAMEGQLASLGGLELSVKQSRLMPGAIDVECQFYYSGHKVTHTVHLW